MLADSSLQNLSAQVRGLEGQIHNPVPACEEKGRFPGSSSQDLRGQVEGLERQIRDPFLQSCDPGLQYLRMQAQGVERQIRDPVPGTAPTFGDISKRLADSGLQDL